MNEPTFKPVPKAFLSKAHKVLPMWMLEAVQDYGCVLGGEYFFSWYMILQRKEVTPFIPQRITVAGPAEYKDTCLKQCNDLIAPLDIVYIEAETDRERLLSTTKNAVTPYGIILTKEGFFISTRAFTDISRKRWAKPRAGIPTEDEEFENDRYSQIFTQFNFRQYTPKPPAVRKKAKKRIRPFPVENSPGKRQRIIEGEQRDVMKQPVPRPPDVPPAPLRCSQATQEWDSPTPPTPSPPRTPPLWMAENMS